MKRLIMIVALALLVSGCVKHPVKSDDLQAEIKANHREMPLAISAWAQAVKSEVEDNMHCAGQYAGKTCSVRLFLQPDGLILGAQSEGGDPALCHTAISAIKASTFPPVPKELLGQNGIVFDFKP